MATTTKKTTTEPKTTVEKVDKDIAEETVTVEETVVPVKEKKVFTDTMEESYKKYVKISE